MRLLLADEEIFDWFDSDIMFVSWTWLMKNKIYGNRVIFNKKQVPGVITRTIYRQGFVLVNIIDKKHDQFFRKMIGSVTISAIAYKIRKTIDFSISSHKIIWTGTTCKTGFINRKIVEVIVISGCYSFFVNINNSYIDFWAFLSNYYHSRTTYIAGTNATNILNFSHGFDRIAQVTITLLL